jgi:hypothetical protein
MSFYGGTDRKAFRERLRQDKALRTVCGWPSQGQVPSESTFIRTFTEFAETGLADQVHDSQVAIPLFKLVQRRITVLYDLLDKAYDAAPIHACSEHLGHQPIIDRMKWRGQPPPSPMESDRAERFKGRTVAERFNARLKDEFGGLVARVRGHRKVHAHLMFGLLVIFADQVLRIGQ